MITTIWTASSSWALTALPLFIWMGEILYRTRLSEDMFKGLAPWMGRLPGRLLHTNILGCTVFAAVSPSPESVIALLRARAPAGGARSGRGREIGSAYASGSPSLKAMSVMRFSSSAWWPRLADVVPGHLVGRGTPK